MDQHPIQGGTSNTPSHFMLGILWCNTPRPASHPGGTSNTLGHFMLGILWWLDQHPIQGGLVILLVTSCWVSSERLASHLRKVVILLVPSCWVSFDGLVSHLRGSSHTSSDLWLGFLWGTSIPSWGRGGCGDCYSWWPPAGFCDGWPFYLMGALINLVKLQKTQPVQTSH